MVVQTKFVILKGVHHWSRLLNRTDPTHIGPLQIKIERTPRNLNLDCKEGFPYPRESPFPKGLGIPLINIHH